jgi:hypothetical protein
MIKQALMLGCWLACTCALLGACASGEACRRDPITGSDRCQPASGNAGEAIGTAVAATAAWTAVGCTVNGCEPPFYCNGETKMCERIRCDEGGRSCPPAYVCDLEDHVCR